nr:hypothetical protein HmN_000100600 [Hymenolepis microstoma]
MPQCENICGLAEAHRIISDNYGKTAISDRTCQWEWFQRLKCLALLTANATAYYSPLSGSFDRDDLWTGNAYHL